MIQSQCRLAEVTHYDTGCAGKIVVCVTISKHDVQHGSAKHSVNGGLAFLWEMRFSTPYSSAPNEPIEMAFGTRD